MIQIKKTILTLVALLAVTTGAWAQSTLDVVELGVPAEWATDNSNMTAADLPGFKASTLDEAKAWTGAPKTVVVYLIYAFNGEGFNYVSFEKGKYTGDNFQPLPKNSFFGPSDVKFYYTTGSAIAVEVTSGPEVAWDKDENTGSFKMPGGNVTLEPEYYPQATVADDGVTAADADARATTDDPLVKVDATKLTGAKKLMYFVSNSGTTAPAYDAEGWTDQLPTAEGFTEAGTVYVWYYPVGTDEGQDGATATYSDGDMNATALTVTIAAAPTYAVTFAEGVNPAEPAEPEWTAEPAAGVTKGTPVTVSYTGSKKVIGVKAEKKAAEPAISFNKVHWGYLENAPASIISVSQTDAKAAADAEKTKVNAPGYVCFYALEGGQYKWIDSHGRTGQGSDLESIVNGDAWAEVYECYQAGYNDCIWFTVSQ